MTWTLRLKSHKSTVLLHVNPLSTFSTIKSDLYTALQETTLHSSTGDSIPLPSSASEIQLARPRNVNDPSRGFTLGEWEPSYGGSELGTGDEEEAGSKGKGKAPATTKGKPGKKDSGADVKDCPKGAGLRDNAVLAFRWVGEGMWDGETEDNMWGVRIASFEDPYGATNEGDVGGMSEFEG
jgi:hypothetical protein